MTIELISPTDNVVRYVSPSKIKKDGFPDGSAFILRSSMESGLSVNWLEYFPEDKQHQLTEVRKLIRLTLKASGRFAEINVGHLTNTISSILADFAVVHCPLSATGQFDADPSHSQMTGLPTPDSDIALLVGEMIAECVFNLHQAVVPTQI